MTDPPSDQQPLARQPYRVCFICSGNICRSPTGEIVLRAMLQEAGLGDAVAVDSAGTGHWNVGEAVHGPALKALRRHGYDGSAHVARQVSASWLGERDLILAADKGHVRELRHLVATDQHDRIRLLREFDPAAAQAGTLEVDDPYYGRREDFERAFAEIERACRGLVGHLRAHVAAQGTPG
jgi:protein-tyrosine phosphatase